MKKVMFMLTLVLISLTTCFSQDTLKFSVLQNGVRQEPKGEFTFYQSKDGFVYKIGDRLKIGVPSSNKTFAFITQGDGFLIPITPLTVNYSGSESEIKKFFITGNKRMGFNVGVRSKGVTGMCNYGIDFENAIANGELKSFGKTSDEALTELKKAKDKLDLGLITQDDFDKTKIELLKYIK